MSARRKRVISTDDIQFNHKPAKNVIGRKKRESVKMAKSPNIIWICSHCVLDRPVFEWNQVLLHPDLTRCGLSSLPMVPTTINFTAPPTPITWKQFLKSITCVQRLHMICTWHDGAAIVVLQHCIFFMQEHHLFPQEFDYEFINRLWNNSLLIMCDWDSIPKCIPLQVLM